MVRAGWFDRTLVKGGWFDATVATATLGWFDVTLVENLQDSALAGESDAVAGQSGTLTAAGTLAGTTGATAGQTGTLTGIVLLEGTSTATGDQTGTLTGIVLLEGTSTATTSQQGALLSAGALAGTATATGGQTGTLTASSPGVLAGVSAAVASQAGTLTDATPAPPPPPPPGPTLRKFGTPSGGPSWPKTEIVDGPELTAADRAKLWGLFEMGGQAPMAAPNGTSGTSGAANATPFFIVEKDRFIHGIPGRKETIVVMAPNPERIVVTRTKPVSRLQKVLLGIASLLVLAAGILIGSRLPKTPALPPAESPPKAPSKPRRRRP
jgi:hypothetical protein